MCVLPSFLHPFIKRRSSSWMDDACGRFEASFRPERTPTDSEILCMYEKASANQPVRLSLAKQKRVRPPSSWSSPSSSSLETLLSTLVVIRDSNHCHHYNYYWTFGGSGGGSSRVPMGLSFRSAWVDLECLLENGQIVSQITDEKNSW